MDYRTEAPNLIRDFLTYHRTIQGHSIKTVDEYYLDLRTFFRFIKVQKGLVPRDADFEEIDISDVDISLVRTVTLADVYAFMDYLDRDRSLSAPSRARKVATIRSFFKYLSSKAKLITENPMQDLDSPRLKKRCPGILPWISAMICWKLLTNPTKQEITASSCSFSTAASVSPNWWP